MNNLLFSEITHTYEINGKKLPSVSDLISIYGNDIPELLETTFELARERGVILHQYIESILNEVYLDGIPTEYEPYIDSIDLFFAEHNIEPIKIEEPICTDIYAGTPDLLCFYEGILTVIDYKFVAQISKTKVKAQLNFYKNAYEYNNIYPEQLLTVQFLPYKPRIYPTAISDYEMNLALSVYELKNKKYGKGKID